MKGKVRTGSDVIVATLENLGVEHVFGMPGTQNVRLYESLRKSDIRTVVNTSELAGAFMANGYARSSGKVGVVATIPGPGFAFALPGIAEAFLDSAPLLWIVETPASRAGKKFAQQAIDQAAIAKPITKKIFEVSELSELSAAVTAAYQATTAGEPGPVLLHVNGALLGAEGAEGLPTSAPANTPDSCVSPLKVDAGAVEQIWNAISNAHRPVIFVGQGSSGASALVEQLAARLKAPVVATRSARGVVAEDNPLTLVFTFDNAAVNTCNELLDASDVILALGTKFAHNGTAGFRLRMPQEKLIHVDASADSLNANYPARVSLQSDVSRFLTELSTFSDTADCRDSGWSTDDLARWKNSGRATENPDSPEPTLGASAKIGSFFEALRKVMPRESCLVTDSGQHQILTTRHAQILAPRGLVIPTDFQSMGFGIPAAIGAKFAKPGRCVVAIVGDGGLAMIGLELATAVREKVQLTVVVFNDGALGQIRTQQMGDYGHAFGTDLGKIDIALMAAALECNYVPLGTDLEADLKKAISAPGVTLVDVPIGDSAAQKARQAKAYVRSAGRELLPTQLRKWIAKRIK